MASKAKPVDEAELEKANRELREALHDCHEQLERAKQILASRQDNKDRPT